MGPQALGSVTDKPLSQADADGHGRFPTGKEKGMQTQAKLPGQFSTPGNIQPQNDAL